MLQRASRGKGRRPHHLAAYQIFGRLSASRAVLVNHYGSKVGAGSKKHFTPASSIASIIRNHMKRDVVHVFVASKGITFNAGLAGSSVPAGYPVTTFYRLR